MITNNSCAFVTNTSKRYKKGGLKARLTNAKGDKVYAETALNAKVGKGMGNLLESVGITPDYLLDEMTGEEKEKLYQNDPTAADRGLKKAMEVLK